MAKPTPPYLFLASVILVGLNLRPIIASIGPLLDQIQDQTALSDTAASLLTTLPVSMMGIFLLGISRLRQATGERSGVLCGVALICLANLARLTWPGTTQLMLTAALGGIGIAVVQALMPITIRRHAGPRAATLMGFYSTAIMGGALMAGVASPWLANLWSWPSALAIWALPAFLGAVVWMTTEKEPQSTPELSSVAMYCLPRAWTLLVFFGLATGAYTLLLAWLPPFFTQLG